MDEVLPSWLEDGKGLRGDAAPPADTRLEFPPARITNVEPQVPQGDDRPLFSPDGGGATSGGGCPFDAIIAPGGDSSTLSVTFQPGTANSLLPDNIFDTFTVAASDVTKVKVRAVSDGTKITGCSLVLDTDEAAMQTPTPFGLPVSVDVLVSVIAGQRAYRVIPCGSVTLAGQQQYITDKSPPADPGQLPYTPYYIWQVVS